jgi:hypothetical protein
MRIGSNRVDLAAKILRWRMRYDRLSMTRVGEAIAGRIRETDCPCVIHSPPGITIR